MIQDGVALLALMVISICIAVLTYFFFRSFSEHRSVLEKRWYTRGERSLAAGKPVDAVEDFRSALALSTANPRYELALAEALAQANRNEEAYAYFSSLHEAEPGDGYLNLQLARLEVRRRNPTQAIAYYRSALSGLWHGQGAEQRFQIRLELAKYLLSLGKSNDAQGDLLTAEGNSLDNPAQLLEVAALLQQAADPSDALMTYRRVETHAAAHPSQALAALLGEADAAQAMGQYKRAAQALERYLARARQHPHAASPSDKREAELRLEELQRMLQLIPFYALPPKQHVQRILLGAGIAHQRYVTCAAKYQPPLGSAQGLSAEDAASLAQLGSQWTEFSQVTPAALLGNASQQVSMQNWTDAVEELTASLCGAPTGDNALLLELAQNPDKTE